jgi:5S rRNA maturation endonuclease (ribonuclease M5)
MQLKKQTFITKQFLFSKISEYDVYRYYVGEFKLGQTFCSPLRKDNNPSFTIFAGQDGRLHHIDHADDRYKGDCIDIVQSMFNLDTRTAMEKIAKDFFLLEGKDEHKKITSLYTKPVIDPKRHAMIQVTTKPFTAEDKAYWLQFGITRDELKKEDVYSVKDLYINRRREIVKPGELCFAYRYDEGFKIYFPNRPKEQRWKSNITTKTVENLNIINDAKRVLVTKSKKDRLVLARYFPTVISVQNESRSCFTEQFVSMLSNKEVWINYDSDEAGVKACKTITEEFGYRYINIPKKYLPIKDFADLYKEYGEEPIVNYLKEKGFI